jgi:hypothetical protein
VPLIDLNKKGEFKWPKGAQHTFEKINKVMNPCPVLALPYFSQPFILECDASGEGIRAILMQNRHPIYFERRNLRGDDLLYTIYDKYMLSIMQVLDKFR